MLIRDPKDHTVIAKRLTEKEKIARKKRLREVLNELMRK